MIFSHRWVTAIFNFNREKETGNDKSHHIVNDANH